MSNHVTAVEREKRVKTMSENMGKEKMERLENLYITRIKKTVTANKCMLMKGSSN